MHVEPKPYTIDKKDITSVNHFVCLCNKPTTGHFLKKITKFNPFKPITKTGRAYIDMMFMAFMS